MDLTLQQGRCRCDTRQTHRPPTDGHLKLVRLAVAAGLSRKLACGASLRFRSLKNLCRKFLTKTPHTHVICAELPTSKSNVKTTGTMEPPAASPHGLTMPAVSRSSRRHRGNRDFQRPAGLKCCPKRSAPGITKTCPHSVFGDGTTLKPPGRDFSVDKHRRAAAVDKNSFIGLQQNSKI